jgi:hypothetical protein
MENDAGADSPPVSVSLMARNRGKKWKTVVDNVKLRVPSTGKRIRLVLTVTGQDRIDWSSLKLHLHELGCNIGLDSIASNWSHVGDPQISNSRCLVELHLEPSRKLLQFRGSFNTSHGEEIAFSSVAFRSSNSGTSHAERKTDDPTQTSMTYSDRDLHSPPPAVSLTMISHGSLAVEGQVRAAQCPYRHPQSRK